MVLSRARRAVSFGVFVAVVLDTAPAIATDKQACLPAYHFYNSAREREESGHLREARGLLQSCAEDAQSTCPGLAQKCKNKYSLLGLAMPSVVPLVADETGAPQVDVQVKIDGELLTPRLDGRAVPVDIGLHEFTFSTDAGVFATEKVMIPEGQRNQLLSVIMRAPPDGPAQASPPAAAVVSGPSRNAQAPSDKTPSERPGADKGIGEVAASERTRPDPLPEGASGRRSSVPAFVVGGAGLLGVGAGVLLTLWGKEDTDALAQCAPRCKQSSVDHVRALYIASDVSLGVGAVALGAAAWLFVRSRSTDSAVTRAAAYELNVQPSPSGAVASVKGVF